jgi:hypothetical protein
MEEEVLPPWAREEPPWWYTGPQDGSLVIQALRWACAGIKERMKYWNCPRFRAGLQSEDGYLPGVRWNPVGYPQHRLSVHRVLAALRCAYDHQDRETLEELSEVLGIRPLSLERRRKVVHSYAEDSNTVCEELRAEPQAGHQ